MAGQFGSSFSSDSIQIGLTAQDNFGNVTPKIMPANNVHVNTKGPTFGSNIFILPSVGSIIAGGSVCSITWNWANISFNVQAKNYPLTLQYSLDNGNTFINSAAGNLQNTGSYSWTTPLLTSKNVLLRFTARDTLGNVSYGPLSAAFTIDATPPASNITLPANKSYVNSLANISGNTSDIGSGVKNVFITIKMIAGNYWNGVSAWTPTQTWLSTVLSPSNTWVCNNNAPTGLTNGSTIAIMSLATDSANNAQTIYGADTVTVDTIAPVSTVTYPVNNTSISSLGNISGTASDVGAGVSSLVISFENMTDTTYWNGAGWVKVQAWLPPFGPPIGFSPWNFTPPALTNGKKYLVQSKAIDAAGNMEAPGPGVTFVYSTSAPGLPTIAIVNKQKYINNPLDRMGAVCLFKNKLQHSGGRPGRQIYLCGVQGQDRQHDRSCFRQHFLRHDSAQMRHQHRRHNEPRDMEPCRFRNILLYNAGVGRENRIGPAQKPGDRHVLERCGMGT